MTEFSGFFPASDLLPEDEQEDESAFEPGARYKGFLVTALSGAELREIPEIHQSLPARFYVETPEHTIGLVPWPGSQIIWPWEAGWVQDMRRAQVESLTRPERKAKGR